jgi:DNA repair photolyase
MEPKMPVIHEINCKSLMNKSGIPGIDYGVNPYTGCIHACAYCYARFMSRHTAHGMAWGDFCDVKVNAVQILEKELRKRAPGLVSLSTVTDPYQAPEQKYGITREILIRLADADFPVSILTKSDLVLRDLDVLKRFPAGCIQVGFSLNTSDDAVSRAFEPGAPAASKRIQALKRLHEEGISTWVFLAPVLPVLTEKTLPALLDEIRGSADQLLADGLNIKCGNWRGISSALQRHQPSLRAEWEAVLLPAGEKERTYDRLYGRIRNLCEERGIPADF